MLLSVLGNSLYDAIMANNNTSHQKPSLGGLYTGFESYRILTKAEISEALEKGFLAMDTNVLLNLYRYNDKTVDDILNVAEFADNRLFVPHQVIREFWRNRQSVISELGKPSKNARDSLAKNQNSTKDVIERWSKSIALQAEERDELKDRVDSLFSGLIERIGEESHTFSAHTPTSEDRLLNRLDTILADSVGPPLEARAWEEAVAEGERRVAEQISPGYKDFDKLESDIPEKASGDYLVWKQLLIEGEKRGLDLVLVTSDTKEDWWNRTSRGEVVGPRRELIDEYLDNTGKRFFLLEPAKLLNYFSDLGVKISPDSVEDIKRVRDETREIVPWTLEALQAVLEELDYHGLAQADVIREAAESGGKILRERVYELDGREEGKMLRGFTRPVTRITAELQENDLVPYGVESLLTAVYESGVEASHFAVPSEVVSILDDGLS